jgi:hypothetical protein
VWRFFLPVAGVSASVPQTSEDGARARGEASSVQASELTKGNLMPEKLDLEKVVSDSFFTGFIAHVIADKFNQVCPINSPQQHSRVWEITLTINGVELPVRPFVDAVEQHMEQMVQEKAIKLLDEKLGELHSLFYDVERALKSKLFDM